MRCFLFSIVGGNLLLAGAAAGCNTAGPPAPVPHHVPQHQVPQHHVPQQPSAGQMAPDVGGQAYEMPPTSSAPHSQPQSSTPLPQGYVAPGE